jgi:hypothetical protein
MNPSTTSTSNTCLAKKDKIDSFPLQSQSLQSTSSNHFELHEDLNDCMEDTADNYTQEHPEHYCLSSEIFESALFSILKENIEKLIDDFSTSPYQHLTPQQQARLDGIASEYLADS